MDTVLSATRVEQDRRFYEMDDEVFMNLFDRENERGTNFDDAEIVVGPGGELVLITDSEDWLGMLPSLGISWEF